MMWYEWQENFIFLSVYLNGAMTMVVCDHVPQEEVMQRLLAMDEGRRPITIYSSMVISEEVFEMLTEKIRTTGLGHIF